MAATTTYSIKASAEITRIRQGRGTRRRGGLEFGADPVLVSLQAAPGVNEVSKEALEAILADEHLVHQEAAAPAPAAEKAGDKPPKKKAAGKRRGARASPSPSSKEEEEEAAGDEPAGGGEGEGSKLPKWPLRMKPATYVERHPAGEHAELARTILAAEEK